MIRPLRALFIRLKSLFDKHKHEQDLAEELESNLQLHIAENIRSGMTVQQARRVALMKFGSIDAAKEAYRDRQTIRMIETLAQDVGYALRMLRRTPLFALTAVLSLAIGIGANTAIFAVVRTVLLQALPYPESDRIVNITRADGGNNSVPMFLYWAQNNPGFEDLSAYQTGASLSRAGMNLDGGEKPEIVQAVRASRNYFRLFGATPILGRTFTTDEDQPGGSRVLVISYGLWQRIFGGDPLIVGKTLTLGGTPHTCVGVTSPGFTPYPTADVWMPLQADPKNTNQAHTLIVSARLPRDKTLVQANSQMAAIGKQFVQEHPQQLGSDDRLRVTFMQERMTRGARPALLILMGAVGLVLLIACANVANLLLARATARQKEIAIRAAIGGGRARIVRQLLTETALLAVIGGICGLLLGSWGVRALLRGIPSDLPRIQEIAAVAALDPWITGFTFFVAIVTGVLFGLFPAVQLSRTDVAASLKQSSGRMATSLKHNHTRTLLVGVEVAMAVVLLCGAVLLIRSFVALHNVSLGFDPHNVLTMEVSLAGSAYSKSSDVDRIARAFVDRVQQIPGVESAAMASGLPLEGGMDMIFDIPGRARLEGFKFAGDVQFRVVSERYFDVLRIPLIKGRLFREHERGRTVVINQAMASQFWPNIDPVGQTIVIGPGLGGLFADGDTEIVGVVGDVRELLDSNPPPTMYQTELQLSDAAIALLNEIQAGAVIVRTRESVAPMSIERQIRQALLSSGLPAGKVRTMDQVSMNSTARRNFDLILLGLFAVIALVLAAVGIYGVMSYSVEQRTLEIGIRAAMGANRRDLLTLVLGQASRMTLTGVAAGIIASLGLTRFMKSQLFGVTSSDPLTFLIVPLILLAIALAAACIPALRAIHVDPLVALRHE